MKRYLLALILGIYALAISAQTLYSPDSVLRMELKTGNFAGFTLYWHQQKIISNETLGLKVYNGTTLGQNPVIIKTETGSESGNYKPLYGQERQIAFAYNSLLVWLKDSVQLEFRLYNNGIAYRIHYTGKSPILLENELLNFKLQTSSKVWNPAVSGFANTFEPEYTEMPFTQVPENGFSLLPFLSKADSLPYLLISEANIGAYPGMYLTKRGDLLYGLFPPYVTKETYKTAYKLRITDFAPFSGRIAKETAPYIAHLAGESILPWRVIMVAENETDLLTNRLVYLLGDEPEGDFSWVKPGLVAWDWYNHWELTGTSFKPGKNTATYKYFIDFAAKNGIPYINLDEGWNHNKKVFKLNPKIDVHEILRYAEAKNVGVFLWFMWDGLEENMEAKLDSFAAWGVAGLKVDFFDRDDQKMTAFAENLAKEAAKQKLMLNLHGIWKPDGLEKTYPNVINREGIIGLENNKFGSSATASHNVTLPYTRFVCGSADYTPGALFHVKPEEYKKNWSHPAAMTTRCQQLAMYVVYYGALQMMPEAPTAYEQEPEMLQLISKMPTTWEISRALQGKVGEYVVMARSKDRHWYIAGMTDNAQQVSLHFDFLKQGETYRAVLYSDGEKSIENPAHYEKKEFTLTHADQLDILMQANGGFLLVLKKE